ncbi:peptidase M48 [Longibacter salinarum]|uniref:Peptidase M48 n=2 Tax=Longibacter salinarum TaxID=1850348 RepID=A0A2A8CUY4_9BACT|nr:peptidase M48 [Longibacter salinarum]
MTAALSLTVPACTTGVNPVSGNTRAMGYSWEQELQLGKQADQQIQQQFGVYESEELQRYVDRIAQDVLAVSHMRRPDTPDKFRNAEFTFRVLDSEVINAFALPGGYVYVTRGLLAHLNNEAQLAVVLGHEIAHVAARHASQQAGRQQLTQLGVLGAGVAGGLAFGGETARSIMGLGGQAAQLFSLKYSRENERESDRLGVEYAVKAGYEASEGADFFTTLKRKRDQSGQSIPSWQSTHPDPGERETSIVRLAQEWQGRVAEPANEIDQGPYYNAIARIILGKNPRQGFTEDNTFYHPDLRFSFPYPAGWQVINQPRQVAVVEPDQSAYVTFSFSQEDSPRAAATAFAGQEGLTTVDRSSTSINGLNAERLLVSGKTQQGGEVRALSYFIAYDDNVYRFTGITTSQRYNQYESEFERTMRGFDQLRDPAKLNVEPARIAIRDADTRRAFSQFVEPSRLPKEMNSEDLAILNQVELQQTIERGQPLKLPN